MAHYNHFHILILLFIFLYTTTTHPPTKLATADDDLIQKTCKTTKYVDLCLSSLKSDPSSSQSDLKGLATIMVNLGIANASNTYSYLSTQLQNTHPSSSTSTSTSTSAGPRAGIGTSTSSAGARASTKTSARIGTSTSSDGARASTKTSARIGTSTSSDGARASTKTSARIGTSTSSDGARASTKTSARIGTSTSSAGAGAGASNDNSDSNKNVTAVRKTVLGLCATKYANANESLTSTIDDLDVDNYDYAIIHVTAAADYPNVCRNAFKRYRGMRYPGALKAREDGLKKICGVLLGILNQLVNDNMV